jgi:hypothetical protein
MRARSDRNISVLQCETNARRTMGFPLPGLEVRHLAFARTFVSPRIFGHPIENKARRWARLQVVIGMNKVQNT